jgi:nitrosocyanin
VWYGDGADIYSQATYEEIIMFAVRRSLIPLAVIAAITGALLTSYVEPASAGEVQKFTLVNVIFDGTKIWLPSSLMVHEGDEVELTLINKLDAPHGFKIEAFGVEEVVQPKAKTTVRFTASKAGIYPYVCQLHPPHIGGQILVLGE